MATGWGLIRTKAKILFIAQSFCSTGLANHVDGVAGVWGNMHFTLKNFNPLFTFQIKQMNLNPI